jgi:tRNA(fMet)-specific endonuclease VapC
MTPYVLDTDTLTLHQENHPAVVGHVAQHPPADIAITVLTVEEQMSGWYTRLRRARDVDDLAAVYERLPATAASLGRFQILSFTKPAILRFEQLRAAKLGVAKMDLRIAAVTLEVGGTVVTRNRRDFQRVPGLAIEDWSVSPV